MATSDFNPFDLFRQLEEELLTSTSRAMRVVMFHPRMDMYETAESLIIKMELAGVDAGRLNIELSADDRTLTVAGAREESQEDHHDRLRCCQLEIYYGKFEREILLPSNVRLDREHIRAGYRDGFLVITLPKRDPEVSEKRTITVNE